jgi:hypothetical protein
MPRKGWNSLSADYRARLEKNGIGKKDYEKGASIQAARGHKATPERPTQAAAFPIYKAQRDALVTKIVTRKHAFFGTSPKWNPLRAKKVFERNPPAMAKLRFWSSLSQEEWLDEIRKDADTASYLGYH